MSEDPAEARVSGLLRGLRDAPAPSGEALPGTVVRTARWQRPLRRVLVAVTTTGGGCLDGLAGLVRRRR
jgi:hypothetical protein